MNWLVALIIVYMLCLMLSIMISNGRLITPGVLFFGSFTSMLVTTCILEWYFQFRVSERTFLVMYGAAITFFCFEQGYKLFLKYLHLRRRCKVRKAIDQCQKPIEIQNVISSFFLIYMIIAVLISLMNLYTLAGGDASWNETMHTYRMDRINTRGVDTWKFTLINQVISIALGLSYVCAYIIVYNRQVCGIRLHRQKKLILICLLFAPLTLIGTGGRQSLVELVVSIGVFYLLLVPASGKRLKLWKILLTGCLFVVIFAVAFTGFAALVGRSDTYRDPVFYIVEYICGGFANFNSNINRPYIHEYWGQATFANLYAFANKLGIIPDDMVLSYHEFGWKGQYTSSTTVTLFGRWYEDFGTLGVCIMAGIVALVFSWLLYDKIDRKPTPNLFHIIYASQVMALIWAGYDDRFYVLIAMVNFVRLFWITFFYWLFIGRGRRFIFIFKGQRRLRFRILK